MFGKRRRRWPNIQITMRERRLFVGISQQTHYIGQCWANVEPSSTKLAQRQPSIGPMYPVCLDVTLGLTVR